MPGGAVVALRADLNVPLDHGRVADATRIEGAIPTLDTLVRMKARVVVLSHLGNPGARRDPHLTLAPVAGRLRTLMDAPVEFLPYVAGPQVHEAVGRLSGGSVLMLENTRFVAGETANDRSLAGEWAGWADHFVNDAFGAAHRAHASTDRLPRLIRGQGGLAVAGQLMWAEVAALRELLNPRRPYVVVLGGAKIRSKVDAISSLLGQADTLLLGGVMANTFLMAKGLETGKSRVEPEAVDIAARMLDASPLVLPVDCTVASALALGAETRSIDCGRVGVDDVIGDIGPRTSALFADHLARAATVFWNGPMGAFEIPEFAAGSYGIAAALAVAADNGAAVVVGGGDSSRAVHMGGVAERIRHISTGGGASLALLAGKLLPAVEALSDRIGSGTRARVQGLEVQLS